MKLKYEISPVISLGRIFYKVTYQTSYGLCRRCWIELNELIPSSFGPSFGRRLKLFDTPDAARLAVEKEIETIKNILNSKKQLEDIIKSIPTIEGEY